VLSLLRADVIILERSHADIDRRISVAMFRARTDLNIATDPFVVITLRETPYCFGAAFEFAYLGNAGVAYPRIFSPRIFPANLAIENSARARRILNAINVQRKHSDRVTSIFNSRLGILVSVLG